MTSREVALAILRDVFPAPGTSERSAQESLDYRTRKAGLAPRDRAFATELAYGSIKMRRTLDWYLQPYVGGRGKPLPPAISEIVRLGAYEILYTRADEHAAVNEWVNVAKKYGHRGTAGLVNAVLRGLLRDKPVAPDASSFEDPDEFLGTRYSFPTWIVRRFREVFGTDSLEAILEGCNAPAKTAVTVNRARATREQIAALFDGWGSGTNPSLACEDSLLVADASEARAHEAAAAGTWWIQSESSAMPVDILNPQPDETVLDVCSGRGNKAMQTAARRGEESMGLTCIERDPRKVEGLRDRLASAGFSAAIVTGDAVEIARAADVRYDRILLDAPCSGIGVLGRHPEARWRKNPGDGDRLSETQAALLDALVPCLHPGGVLVYAVCSVDARETTQVVERVLRSHNVERGLMPGRYEAFIDERGDAIVPPGIDGRDGFYIARLERRL
ncbi:MAG: hypothetical protein M3Y18_05810 [Candidatus Eremiobacteraeota bacterium]|nr:hypothetical protein [Candidatus Eremiobacteraeota bacterium]